MSFATDSSYEKRKYNDFEDVNCVTDSVSDEEGDCSSQEYQRFSFSG